MPARHSPQRSSPAPTLAPGITHPTARAAPLPGGDGGGSPAGRGWVKKRSGMPARHSPQRSSPAPTLAPGITHPTARAAPLPGGDGGGSPPGRGGRRPGWVPCCTTRWQRGKHRGISGVGAGFKPAPTVYPATNRRAGVGNERSTGLPFSVRPLAQAALEAGAGMLVSGWGVTSGVVSHFLSSGRTCLAKHLRLRSASS